MPGSKHVSYDTNGLDTERISVDLCLRESVFVMFQPEEEAVLKWKALDSCTHWRPEEEDPAAPPVSAVMNLDKICFNIMRLRRSELTRQACRIRVLLVTVA